LKSIIHVERKLNVFGDETDSFDKKTGMKISERKEGAFGLVFILW